MSLRTPRPFILVHLSIFARLFLVACVLAASAMLSTCGVCNWCTAWIRQGLRTTTAWAKASGLADISNPATLNRLRHCGGC